MIKKYEEAIELLQDHGTDVDCLLAQIHMAALQYLTGVSSQILSQAHALARVPGLHY